MNVRFGMKPGRWPGALLALAGALFLGACAPVPPAAPQAGRMQLVLPGGRWVELGGGDQTVRQGPVALPIQTRVVGLKGPQDELQAVLVVQGNRDGDQWARTPWDAPCPPQQGLYVEDAAQGSKVRIDCLRFKRWADNGDWLAKNAPEVQGWLQRLALSPSGPYSHVSFRYTTEAGAYIAVDALVDRRLLLQRPRDAVEFLQAGHPAIAWSQDLARSVRVSSGMLNGHLRVPAFPFALPR